jgi:DNA-binding XRE family transcriptional regulator
VVTSPVSGDAADVAKQKYRSIARRSPELAATVKRLGAGMRELRKAAGLTQEQLAGGAKLDVKHVQAIERGIGNPTVATLLALARALEVDVRDLLPSIR